MWCWRRPLRVPWTARKPKKSIVKEISPGYSLEGLMLKLKSNPLASWFEELTHWKRPWCWERLKAGREGDARGWDGSMASLTQWTWFWASSGCWWWTGMPAVLQSMGLQRVGHDWVTEQDWIGLSSISRRRRTLTVVYGPCFISTSSLLGSPKIWVTIWCFALLDSVLCMYTFRSESWRGEGSLAPLI